MVTGLEFYPIRALFKELCAHSLSVSVEERFSGQPQQTFASIMGLYEMQANEPARFNYSCTNTPIFSTGASTRPPIVPSHFYVDLEVRDQKETLIKMYFSITDGNEIISQLRALCHFVKTGDIMDLFNKHREQIIKYEIIGRMHML